MELARSPPVASHRPGQSKKEVPDHLVSDAEPQQADKVTGRMLSFAEAIALVRQRLNASSGRAAAVVREAIKSGELRIIRDDHIDPISGSLFAIVEQDFLDWLNRQVSTTATTPLAARKPPDRERARQAAIELWGTAVCREVAQWLKKNGQAADISDAHQGSDKYACRHYATAKGAPCSACYGCKCVARSRLGQGGATGGC